MARQLTVLLTLRRDCLPVKLSVLNKVFKKDDVLWLYRKQIEPHIYTSFLKPAKTKKTKARYFLGPHHFFIEEKILQHFW